MQSAPETETSRFVLLGFPSLYSLYTIRSVNPAPLSSLSRP